jgi:CheY-like chemotaxis protein
MLNSPDLPLKPQEARAVPPDLPLMQPQRQNQLHVLLVEHEPDVLNRNSALLLADGYDISTARVADGLSERVTRIQPHLVLMDVLMPGLDTRELAKLAARCRGGSEPVLVVHSKLLRPMLKRVIDVRAVFGLIPKSDNDAEFLRQFRDVADRLTSEMPTQVFVPRPLSVASSGTFAVTPQPEAMRGRSQRHGS